MGGTPPCNWVQNIIDGTKEADRVHYREEGSFLIVEGGKFDAKTMPRNEAKFLVLFNDENLRSLRDLDFSHVDLLERVKLAIVILNDSV